MISRKPLVFLLISLAPLPLLSGRFVGQIAKNDNTNTSSFKVRELSCPEEEASQRKLSGTILLVLGCLGCLANLVLMAVVGGKEGVGCTYWGPIKNDEH